jgi:hypothetical protein
MGSAEFLNKACSCPPSRTLQFIHQSVRIFISEIKYTGVSQKMVDLVCVRIELSKQTVFAKEAAKANKPGSPRLVCCLN